MKKWIYVFAIGFVMSCSDSSDKENETPCSTELTELNTETTWAYSGDAFTITGNNICPSSIKSVTLNGVEAIVTDKTNSSITFTVPAIVGDSAVVNVSFTTFDVRLSDKIAIFSGNGTWKAIQSFPGKGRVNTLTFTTADNKGYVVSGVQYKSFANGTYPQEEQPDAYEYSPSNDTWKFMLSDAKLIDIYNSAPINNKLFLMSNDGTTASSVLYDPASNSFKNAAVPTFGYERKGFAIGNTGYMINNKDNQALEIRQYAEEPNTWSLIKTLSYVNKDATGGNSYFVFYFAFEHQGKAYIGTQLLNSTILTLWIFDPVTRDLSIANTIDLPSNVSFSGLVHLFTINNLAYFIETGESSQGETFSRIVKPSNKLYLYNFALNEWRKVDNQLPQTFYQPTAFTINNRGFAGLGANEVSATFAYPTNFYEFIPK